MSHQSIQPGLCSYELASVGSNKGAPRVWLQGQTPAKGGFLPGVKYRAIPDEKRPLLTLEVIADDQAEGKGKVRVVSGKSKGDKEIPVIDLNSKELLAMFEGINTVRVVVQEGRIFILPVASDLRAKERIERIERKLAAGEPLAAGSLSAGIGILDAAAHAGLKRSGVDTVLAFANEIRDDCMNHAAERNGVFTDSTITLTAPMQELAFDEWAMAKLPAVDLLSIGMPCSGASVAGRTKRGLAHPEAHPDVGHLVVPFLAIVARVNPAALGPSHA